MRICLDISQSAYEGTGSGRYVVELVKALLRQSSVNEYMLWGSAFKKRDRLIALGEEYRLSDSRSTVSQRILPFPPMLFELIWNRLHIFPIELMVGDADIYHSSDWTQAPSRAKKVTTVHDLIPFLFSEYVHPRIQEAHQLRWNHIIKDNVDVIVDAESTKKDILERFNFDDKKIHVIPLACSDNFFEIGKKKMSGDVDFLIDQKKVLDSYGLSGGSYILAVGTLEPRKNIHKLVEVYTKLDKVLQDQFKLVIVGKKAWSAELPVSENVVLTGYVDEKDITYLYSGAKCFAMPSLYEGFGIPVLEAMACGTPVVCSNKSSLPEIAGDAVHYIQDPTDSDSILNALRALLTKSDTELVSFAKKGYDRSMQFSWDRTARETLEVYNKI